MIEIYLGGIIPWCTFMGILDWFGLIDKKSESVWVGIQLLLLIIQLTYIGIYIN